MCHGRLAGTREASLALRRRFLTVSSLTWTLAVTCSWPLMRRAVVCDVTACLTMSRSCLSLVKRGRPDRGRSWTLPVTLHRYWSLHMTDGDTPSRRATTRNVEPSWSQARACPLSSSGRERRWTIMFKRNIADNRGLIKACK